MAANPLKKADKTGEHVALDVVALVALAEERLQLALEHEARAHAAEDELREAEDRIDVLERELGDVREERDRYKLVAHAAAGNERFQTSLRARVQRGELPRPSLRKAG